MARGQAPHKPTATTRMKVAALTAAGVKRDAVCEIVGVSVPTLLKYYQTELKYGREIANGKVKLTAYQMAISGEVPSATFFWLKTQCGWREVQHVELNRTDYLVSDGPVEQDSVDEWLAIHAPKANSDALN